jgi:hypothetical protein
VPATLDKGFAQFVTSGPFAASGAFSTGSLPAGLHELALLAVETQTSERQEGTAGT